MTVAKLEQVLKILVPKVVTDEGIVKEVKEVEVNAFEPIDVIVEPEKSILVILVFLKA
jgi:hypothetical protein